MKPSVCLQKVLDVAPENAEVFYRLVASGADFYFYQDLGEGSYDEHYFNPDCVLLFPHTRRVYWFDLDYLTVDTSMTGVRRHLPSTLRRKKFAFSFHENQISVLVYTLLHSRIDDTIDLRPQRAARAQYVIGDCYERLCEFSAEGPEYPEYDEDLKSAWKSNRKMKIAVNLGAGVLIYPVRLAYHQSGVYSFASKTVAIPRPTATDFSWHDTSVGNICVASDGSCSIFRRNRPRNSFNNFLPTCFPHVVNQVHKIFYHSQNPVKEFAKSLLRHSYGSLLRRYAIPFEIEYLRCPFTIFVRDLREPRADKPLT